MTSEQYYVYQYLSSPKYMTLQIQNKILLHDELQSCLLPSGIRYDVDKVQTSPGDTLTDLSARIIDLEAEINQMVADKVKRISEIVYLIDSLEEPEERTVLTGVFIARMKVEDIAALISCDRSNAYRIRDRGLSHLFPLICNK